jgi:nucleoside-diphosphate-sugar epimerase
MKQSVLVCGATGFVGRNIAERFAKSGKYEVHAVRFNRPEFPLPNTTWHQCDLRDPASVEKLVKGKDIIIQAAATTSGSKDIVTKPFIHVTDNAVMNSLLFRSAFEARAKHVVFFSCTVMYQSSEKPLKESDFDANQPLHPRYFGVGNTKLYIEKMCEFFAGISETKFTAIRHSNIYGPHDKYDLERSHFFGATVTKVMQAEGKMTVWGTGEEERDLLHADDLTDFVQAALEKQKEKYRLYNCGLGRAHSVLNVVNMIIAASGKHLGIEHDLSAPTIKTSLCLDCSLAEKELGWKPKISLEDGIKSTIAWWRENVDPATLKLKTERKAA